LRRERERERERGRERDRHGAEGVVSRVARGVAAAAVRAEEEGERGGGGHGVHHQQVSPIRIPRLLLLSSVAIWVGEVGVPRGNGLVFGSHDVWDS